MDEVINGVTALVARFKASENDLTKTSSTYSETEARSEYIDPFFELLDWDMSNRQGIPNSIKDVVREESQQRESSTKRPDYTFRIAGQRKFFVEAKRPSVDIRSNSSSAIQVRSYGWTASLPISILTNFRTLRVYDTTIQPREGDGPDVALLMTIDYNDLVDHIETLHRLFNRDNVANHSIETHFNAQVASGVQINSTFIGIINDWRIKVANDLNTRYPSLDINFLNDVSQKIINRIIFIRMCEDRGIEGKDRLLNVAKQKDFIEVRSLFRQLDDRYNTGLFDVENDRLQDSYVIDAQLFCDIVETIYFPQAPYNFSVLDADFLGQVYEVFLAKQLFHGENHDLYIADKPSNEGREIVTTPQPIVNEIVRRVFASKINSLITENQFSYETLVALKILDIAVGSSRFLMRAFDELVDAAINVLRAAGDTERVYQIHENEFRLSFAAKKQLLQSCLFGIDIDYNAVEVARFSLIIKLLEDENEATIPTGRKILPNLDQNIVWGNSVVNTDFVARTQNDPAITVPFDIVQSPLPNSFDIVIGNPPYVKTEEMKQKTPTEFEYYKRKYQTPYKQFDKYFVFIERSLQLLNDRGVLGMVIPNKWITIESGEKLRALLASNNLIDEIVDFGSNQVFAERSTYVCLLMLNKQRHESFAYRYVSSYDEFKSNPSHVGIHASLNILRLANGSSWVIPADEREKLLLNAMLNNSIRLGNLCTVFNGIQTSAEDVYPIRNYSIHGGQISFEHQGNQYQIESELTRPYLLNSNIVMSYKSLQEDGRIIFPYYFDDDVPKPIPPERLQREFPLAWAYFNSHKARLEKRSVNPPPPEGVFYAYGRHQALESAFKPNKIIYSVNQKGDKYAIDYLGTGFASGGTAGEVAITNPTNDYAIEFILGYLNQPFSEFFLRKRGSPFRGGYFSRGSAVISDLPIPILDLTNPDHQLAHDRIVNHVRRLIEIQDLIPTASGRNIEALKTEQQRIKNEMSQIFANLIDLTIEFIHSIVLPGEEVLSNQSDNL